MAIQPLPNTFDFLALEQSPPVALWSPHRQQYLAAIGNQVFCYTYSRISGKRGWTIWELPFEVEAMVEWRRNVYIRPKGSSTIWTLDEDAGDEPGFEWEVQFAHNDLGEDHFLKHVKLTDLVQRGKCDMSFSLDPSDPDTRVPIMTIDGSTVGKGKVITNLLAEYVAPHFTGKGPWDFERYVIRFSKGNLL
jgi:hypothetical protein